MKIYLVQHGLALSQEQDPKRGLSEEGRRQARKTAEFLKNRRVEINEIWHSKKARAIETAKILGETLVFKCFKERDDLNPNDPVDRFPQDLKTLNTDVMIVGHLPFLQKLSSLLLTETQHFELIAFSYSGVTCLEYQGMWKIAWFLTPDLL